MFEDKVITVFGVGTIGSLIVEYLKVQKPYTIRVFTNDENALYEAKQKWGYENEMRYIHGDIRDSRKVLQATRNADYVFNAAAIKHVPIAEYNPIECVNTNILGLENIIQACVENKVSKLLHISTDKAVEPTCIMGMSKAIGERLIQIRWAQNPQTEMVCVRLGNVWESRGSFTKLINDCKSEKKPIPITSKDMKRFFMRPKELIEFIMLTFALGGKGEIYIPKLIEQDIMDIVFATAGVNYPIEIIGIRKGEKLREKMISDEELGICKNDNKNYWIIKNKVKL